MAEPTRDDEIKAIWANPNNRFFYYILGALVLIGLSLLIGKAMYDEHDIWGYGINVFTSVISAAATVLILDRLAERRADRKAKEALKQQLKDDAASISNEVAKNAIHQLRRKEWLKGEDGLLKGEDLSGANLADVPLSYANLQGTVLNEANLNNADLTYANLRGAKLIDADLQGAHLANSDLQDARLFIGSDKNMLRARFDIETRLPDGTAWTPDTEMSQFTDPKHPNFWRSNFSESPAYRSKREE